MSDRQIATFVAPSNIAFVKYWGTRDADRVLPFNASISMTLKNCTSTCTVEYISDDNRTSATEIWFRQAGANSRDFEAAREGFAAPVAEHLERLLTRSGKQGSFRVWTENTFPTGAGIASSASGFSALTLAASAALANPPSDPGEASILARLSGSGSAARSVLGGYVEWPADGSRNSYTDQADQADQAERPAAQLADAAHWNLSDVVAVVDAGEKSTSSRDGHSRAPSSPRFEPRLLDLAARLDTVRQAIAGRDIQMLGEVIEEEAIDLHLVAMTSRPPIYYWQGGTIAVLWAIRELRREGVPVFATIDAGPNVHAICPAENEAEVAAALDGLGEVQEVILDGVGEGPRELSTHLGEND